MPAVKSTLPSASSAASKKRMMPTKMKNVPKETSPAPISVEQARWLVGQPGSFAQREAATRRRVIAVFTYFADL